jgi:hypothetical protein
MDRRKKFLVALWTAFGLFWAFMAVETAINPVLEPRHGSSVIFILQIDLVALCGLVVIRVIRSRKTCEPTSPRVPVLVFPRTRSLTAPTDTVAIPHEMKGPVMMSRQERMLCPRFVIGCIVVLLLQTEFGPAAESASLSVNGVTFSDHLGGFTLEKVSGEGSLDDPFVLVEKMTDSNGGTLSFRVQPEFGNRINSQHVIGLAVIKVIENATDLPWTSFELELQAQLGVPSGDSDGLSFGQGSNAGRPFTSDGFDKVTIVDRPYDRVEFDHGRIPIGRPVTLRIVISESMPLGEVYLVQRPGKPVAQAPSTLRSNRLASR